MERRQSKPSIGRSLREYARGFVGGLLFSLPLLYTMEVWWHGFMASSRALLVALAATFTLLVAYNRYAGMHQDDTWAEVFVDSVEELGLGLVTAVALMWVLGRLSGNVTIDEAIGKIVLEGMLIAIGYSVGTAQLGGGDDADDDRTATSDLLGMTAISGCGAMLFAANVAPTQEIVELAVTISSAKILIISLGSVAIAALVIFYINFIGTAQVAQHRSFFNVLRATSITYGVALVTSAVTLWFFGRFDGTSPVVATCETVVLGLPATLGASAGRFLLQT